MDDDDLRERLADLSARIGAYRDLAWAIMWALPREQVRLVEGRLRYLLEEGTKLQAPGAALRELRYLADLARDRTDAPPGGEG